ncbi:TRAP transporter large permease subunit [Rhizobium sp. L1K21]|uniref:TRAP transporter large permease n=1 Tax=Rhizobium sp. L1K21 TaxID=2954933 RepID=UPI0020939500|nr:TRAP transporter large permease subunit [Rhizobium sp. L1K21]MCO6185598.1 TRAP transporter large permease subunit [Rhizobium sp. L1K21]
MSYELIAIFMFSSMMISMLTGQRVVAAIGVVGVVAAALLWGPGGMELGFSAGMKLMKWYALVTLPLFIYMGYLLSESGLAEDLYKMFHVWLGGLPGGLAVGTLGLMVVISAMNGLSVAGMAIGATIALPELLRRGYDKVMVSGVVQAGSSLGILVPPSVVLVLYGMIARQPVGKLWLAGVFPGLLLAALFIIYVMVRCKLDPSLAPALSKEEREMPLSEKLKLLRAGILPFLIFFLMMGLFVMGVTSLVESSAIGALSALLAVWYKGRLTKEVWNRTLEQTLGISAMFMWIIMAALCFGAVFDGLGAVKTIQWLFTEEWGLGPWEILILMQISYIIMGTFLDDTAMLVIVAPLYIPLVRALGFDLVWYGVLYTITCQIAYMTPPFGYNLFLMRAMAPPEIGLNDIYKSIVPFVIIMIIGLLIVTAFPQIALWLPNQVSVRG